MAPEISPNQPSFHVSQPNIISVNHDRSRRCLSSVPLTVLRRSFSFASKERGECPSSLHRQCQNGFETIREQRRDSKSKKPSPRPNSLVASSSNYLHSNNSTNDERFVCPKAGRENRAKKDQLAMMVHSNRKLTWTMSIHSSRWMMLVVVFSTEARAKIKRHHAECRGEGTFASD